jgi:hypothetical protein
MSAKTESTIVPHVALESHPDLPRDGNAASLPPRTDRPTSAEATEKQNASNDEDAYVADWVI